MRAFYLIIFFLSCYWIVVAQDHIEDTLTQKNSSLPIEAPVNIPTKSKDREIVEEFYQLYSGVDYNPNELLVYAAKYLLSTDYVAKTLDINQEEQLIINLREVDCTTFVENCLALSRAIQYHNPDYDYFVRQLKYIRYREGIIQGYTSRLHYTSDWITDNISKGVIEDITYGIGGKKFKVKVNFMSSNPRLYSNLKNNSENIEKMKKIEEDINQRTTYYYIPKNEIKQKQHLIKSGDIICFTTSIAGLDISHIGIAYWNKEQLSFIHASSKYKKVIINPESLTDYCTMNKSNTGIIVLRPVSVLSQPLSS